MFSNWTSGQTFGYGSLAAQAVTTLINSYGSKKLAKHQNAIAQSKANIARINRDMMERQAQARLRQAESDIMSLTMKAGKTKSSQRAALAANGIAVGEGSAAELQASTDIIKEIDKNQIKENAIRDAWGIRQKAVNYEGEALMAEASRVNPSNVMGNTLLSGASQIAGGYMFYNAMGIFDGKEVVAPATDITKTRDLTNPFQRSTRVTPYTWANAIKGMR